jgi:tRNA threonylcarbamoyladenosine biosynthesis protein TsaE
MFFEKITFAADETFNLGKDLSRHVEPGQVVAVFGDMGAGKTVFIRGVCAGLKVIDPVNSPTFIIMNEYNGRCMDRPVVVHHFDFYRISSDRDIAELGLHEFFGQADSITLIEWADHVVSFLIPPFWRVDMERLEEDSRKVRWAWVAGD